MRRRNEFRVVAVKVLLLSTAFALASLVAGWLAVPVLAAVWGVIAPNRKRAPLLAAVSAGWGWALLLLWTAVQGSVLKLADRAAGVMGIGRAALVGMTLGFSLVLAWSAAVVAAAVRPGKGG